MKYILVCSFWRLGNSDHWQNSQKRAKRVQVWYHSQGHTLSVCVTSPYKMTLVIKVLPYPVMEVYSDSNLTACHLHNCSAHHRAVLHSWTWWPFRLEIFRSVTFVLTHPHQWWTHGPRPQLFKIATTQPPIQPCFHQRSLELLLPNFSKVLNKKKKRLQLSVKVSLGLGWSLYRWVPVNPNVNNPNSWIIPSPVEICTPIPTMIMCLLYSKFG